MFVSLLQYKYEMEQGQWRGGDRDECLCLYCNTNTVETEMHALLQCPKHNDDRLNSMNI